MRNNVILISDENRGAPPHTPLGTSPQTPSFVARGCIMVFIFFKKTAQSAVFDKVFDQTFFKKFVGVGEAHGFYKIRMT